MPEANITKEQRISKIITIRTALSNIRWELTQLSPPFTDSWGERYRDAEGCLSAAIVVLWTELERLEGTPH